MNKVVLYVLCIGLFFGLVSAEVVLVDTFDDASINTSIWGTRTREQVISDSPILSTTIEETGGYLRLYSYAEHNSAGASEGRSYTYLNTTPGIIEFGENPVLVNFSLYYTFSVSSPYSGTISSGHIQFGDSSYYTMFSGTTSGSSTDDYAVQWNPSNNTVDFYKNGAYQSSANISSEGANNDMSILSYARAMGNGGARIVTTEIRVYDVYQDVTILNDAPAITTPVLSPSSPTTAQDIVATTTYTDTDNDTGQVYFDFYINGSLVSQEVDNSVTNGSVATASLSSAQTSVGDIVYVVATPYDNTVNGSSAQSTNVTVVVVPPPPEYGIDFVDSCYVSTYTENGDITENLIIRNACEDASYISFGNVNQSVLGAITDGEVIISARWVFVDSSLRPDLDVPSTIVFKNHDFSSQPDVLVDGVSCSACNVTQFSLTTMTVQVPGFSNYSLTGSTDFSVYSDQEPELKDKVYQTIDLGDAYRSQQFACIVQIFAENANGQLVLVQTNPERAPQGKLFGDTDPNQPESLGYFPTVNGIANTYFRGDELSGYTDFEYVAVCTSNSTKLVYEESISTRYSPAGRTLTGRGIWLTDGSNAFYVTVWIVLGILLLWIGGLIWRSVR